MALNKRQYVDGQTIVTASNLNEIQDCIITIEGAYVPKTRKVAGKALSSDITLSAGDVGAVPTSRTINAKALTGNITLSAADVGAVPVARTVNGKALSSNITLSAADVSAVPTTRKVNNKALSADISLAASDVGAVPTSRTVNGKALSSNITLASGDIGDDSGAGGATVKASLAALSGSLNKKFPTSGDSIDEIINHAISAGYGQPFVQPVATGVSTALSGGIVQSACYGFFNYIQTSNRVDYALFNPYGGIIATGNINTTNSAITVTSNNTTKLFVSSTSAWGSGNTLTFALVQANRTAYHFVGFGFASEFEEAYIKIRTDGIVVKKLNGTATYAYEDGNLIITLPNTSYWSYKLEKLLMLPL